MLRQEKDMFDEFEEIRNSRPLKRVHHETCKTHHNSVRSLQIDHWAFLEGLHGLRYIVKNEYVLKITQNDIVNLTRTVKVLLQEQQHSLLYLGNPQWNQQRYYVLAKFVLETEQEQQSLK